jgi:hypothetical protein
MSTFVVAFSSVGGNKLSAGVYINFKNHLAEKARKVRDAGVDIAEPTITELWTNASETHLIVVYTGGTWQMTTGVPSIYGFDVLTALPENFRTSGQYTQIQKS